MMVSVVRMLTNIRFSKAIVGGAVFSLGLLSVPHTTFAAGPTIAEIVADFRNVFGKAPSAAEQEYWKSRRLDKPARTELKGAMYYVKSQGKTVGAPKVATAQDLAAAVPQTFAQVFGRAPRAEEKRWWSDRVLCRDITTLKGLLASLGFHRSSGVAVGSGTKEEFCARAAARGPLVSLNGGLGIGGHGKGPVVRIGIVKLPQEVRITSLGGFLVRLSDETKKQFSPEDVVKVSMSGGKYVVSGPEFRDVSEGPVKFSPVSGAILEVQNYTDRGASGTNYNRFRGHMIVRQSSDKSGLWAINELSTEDYLRGIAETTDNAPEAFMKALAIAARTYVLHHRQNGGRQPGNGFDITNTANDQLYRGYNYEQRVPGFVARVTATAGHVLSYSGKLIAAVYFSGSDGRTRSGNEVWRSSKFPYLQGKDDPYGGSRLRGHGAGMSGDGAVGFARKDGWDYKKILTYYYTGIRIERGY